MTHPHIRRPALLLVLAALAALCLAACGSSSSTSSTSAAAGAGGTTAGSSAARTKLVACLKAHGVTLPARRPGAARAPGAGPYGGGGPGGAPGRRPGFLFGGGAGGGRFANPTFRAAFAACGGRALRPGGARRAQFTKAAVARFSACVKQHGYTLPAPSFSGGPVFPAAIERNAKFVTAARACRSLLAPTRSPGGAGAPGTAPGSGGTSTGAGA